MLAAENGALPGAKVGGMGDVLRDLPRGLVRRGHRVTVLTPSYGFLARLPGAKARGTVSVSFAGTSETCRWLELPSGVGGGKPDERHFTARELVRLVAPEGAGGEEGRRLEAGRVGEPVDA